MKANLIQTKTHAKHVELPLDDDAGRPRPGRRQAAAGAHPGPGEGLPVADGRGTGGGGPAAGGCHGDGWGGRGVATSAVGGALRCVHN